MITEHFVPPFHLENDGGKRAEKEKSHANQPPSPSPLAASCIIDIDITQYYISGVKVTVEVSEEELKDILRVTHEKRKGAAIRQLALEALMLKKRRELLDEVEAGKWSVDLPPIERLREDRNLWRS